MAAAAAPPPALPAPVKLAKTDNVRRKHDRPFDIKLLIIKLEIARVQQQIALQSRTMEVNTRIQEAEPEHFPHIENNTTELPRNNRASYVPRNAAKQFAATTTPMKDEAAAMKSIRRARSTHERRKPDFTTDGRPPVNPKQLQAALSMGMTEEEAVAAVAQADPKRASHVVAAADRKAKRESRAPSAPFDKAAILRSVSTERRRRSQQAHRRSQSPDEVTVGDKDQDGIPAMPSYRPGDAAKRNSAKRQSHFVPPQGKLIAVNQSGTTTHQREHTLESMDPTVARLFADPKTTYADPKRTEIQDPFDFALEDDHHQHHHPHHAGATHRPALKPHDRNDWAQESQAGDDMRHHLHLGRPHWGRRKSSKTNSDREDARRALEGGSNSSRPRPPLRQWSTGHMPEQKGELNTDAVDNKEEKVEKAQAHGHGHGHGHRSIAGFFKRH